MPSRSGSASPSLHCTRSHCRPHLVAACLELAPLLLHPAVDGLSLLGLVCRAEQGGGVSSVMSRLTFTHVRTERTGCSNAGRLAVPISWQGLGGQQHCAVKASWLEPFSVTPESSRNQGRRAGKQMRQLPSRPACRCQMACLPCLTCVLIPVLLPVARHHCSVCSSSTAATPKAVACFVRSSHMWSSG